jgi:hypothetical protein
VTISKDVVQFYPVVKILKKIVGFLLISIIFILFSSSNIYSQQDSANVPKILIFANAIDYPLASDFLDYLEIRNIQYIRPNASDFDEYKEEKLIVILGGPNATDSVGDIVKKILTIDEQNTIGFPGARKYYKITNKWAQRQKIYILAGYDRYETRKTHEENRENISSEVLADEANDFLLEYYSPILFFPEGEKFFPLEIESMHDKSKIKLRGSIKYYDLENASPGIANYDREIPPEEMFIGYKNKIYGRVIINESINRKFLQYWLFYPYNYGINNHEGDWELIQINLDLNNNQPINVFYFFHEYYFDVNWEDLKKIGSVYNDHVVKAYIGSGSHASYPTLYPLYKDPEIIFDLKSLIFTTKWTKYENFVSAHEDNSYELHHLDDINWNIFYPDKWGELYKGFISRFRGGFDGPAPPLLKHDFNTPESPEKKRKTLAFINSPVNLHVYDELGRHVGFNSTRKLIDLEIDDTSAYYKVENEIELIEILTDENLTFEIEGLSKGAFDFNIARYTVEDDVLKEYHIKYIDIPTDIGVTHIVNLEGLPTNDTLMVTDMKKIKPNVSIVLNLKSAFKPSVLESNPPLEVDFGLDEFYKDFLYRKFKSVPYCNFKKPRPSLLVDGVSEAAIVLGTETPENVATLINKKLYSENLDDNVQTDVGITARGDDFVLSETDDSIAQKWLVTEISNLRTRPSNVSKIIELSDNWPDWSTDPSDATEKYGIWFDADGDGDIEKADDWPEYNDIFVVDRTKTDMTIVPAMRVRNLGSLEHQVFELRGTEYWVKEIDLNNDEIKLVKVDEETLVGAQQTQDMLDIALRIPGTDIELGMLNLSGTDATPSAEFAIIEGGNVIKFEDRDQTTDPKFEIGTDLELLDDFYIVPTEIDVSKSVIKLAIGKKNMELTISDGDKNVLGYARAVVDEDGDGIAHEFRLEDDQMIVERGSKEQLYATDTYFKYNDDNEIDILRNIDLPIIHHSKLTQENKTTYNLVIIGEPSENNLTRELILNGKSSVDWFASGGDIEIISDAFNYCKYAIIIGGKDRVATDTAVNDFVAML